MRFSEAFGALGYHLRNPRNEWSAEKSDGVAISIWRKEMGFDRKSGSIFFDTRIHAKDWKLWGHKRGNTVRIRHLKRALAEFDGYVEVIAVSGIPGGGFGSAEPLQLPPSRRMRIVNFDEETGHFRVEVE